MKVISNGVDPEDWSARLYCPICNAYVEVCAADVYLRGPDKGTAVTSARCAFCAYPFDFTGVPLVVRYFIAERGKE